MGDPTDFQLAVKYGRENDALKAELAKQRQLRDDTLARLAESELNRGLAAAIHKEVEAERDRPRRRRGTQWTARLPTTSA